MTTLCTEILVSSHSALGFKQLEERLRCAARVMLETMRVDRRHHLEPEDLQVFTGDCDASHGRIPDGCMWLEESTAASLPS